MKKIEVFVEDIDQEEAHAIRRLMVKLLRKADVDVLASNVSTIEEDKDGT